jgi:hypothetical protein
MLTDNQELFRSIVHRILKDRGQSIPGLGLHTYAIMDGMVELIELILEQPHE